MRRIRKKIKRRVAAVLAACMVTTSFPGTVFAAEGEGGSEEPGSRNIVLHLDQDRLREAVEEAVRSGNEYGEKLDFYTEDGDEAQTELYDRLFEDGVLYEVSLEAAMAATPSNAVEKDSEVTLLVRPDQDAAEAGQDKATPSSARATGSNAGTRATGSDAQLEDYEATGEEQIIILFRNAGEDELVYQIEVNGNLTPEICVPAGSSLVSDLASESDAEELEEETKEPEEETEEIQDDAQVPGAGVPGEDAGGSGNGGAGTSQDSEETAPGGGSEDAGGGSEESATDEGNESAGQGEETPGEAGGAAKPDKGEQDNLGQGGSEDEGREPADGAGDENGAGGSSENGAEGGAEDGSGSGGEAGKPSGGSTKPGADAGNGFGNETENGAAGEKPSSGGSGADTDTDAGEEAGSGSESSGGTGADNGSGSSEKPDADAGTSGNTGSSGNHAGSDGSSGASGNAGGSSSTDTGNGAGSSGNAGGSSSAGSGSSAGSPGNTGGSSSAGTSSGADRSADAAALGISRHIVPLVAAGPSGEEYEPEDSGLTPEEEWELFSEQDEEEDEDGEDAEEDGDDSYLDEIQTMAETSETGAVGTVLEPVLVKSQKKGVRARMARLLLGSRKPVAAAAYVSTLDGLLGGWIEPEEAQFTVDLFDYGTFNGNVEAEDGESYRQSNNIAVFNEYISGEDQDSENKGEDGNKSYLMFPEDGWSYSKTGASAADSLVRGIMTMDENGTVTFSDEAQKLGNKDVTIFPQETDNSEIKDSEGNLLMKIYRNVAFPMLEKVDGESEHYRFSSKETFVSGNVKNGKWVLKDEGTPKNGDAAQPYTDKAGFWPLNKWDLKKKKRDKAGNQYFGMKLSTSFILPSDGKYKGKALKFEFSGDDDVWVFIDGKLALDIGGAHRPVTGEIDFASGFTKIYFEDNNDAIENYNVLDQGYKYDGVEEGGYVAGYIYGTDEEEVKKIAMEKQIKVDSVEMARCIEIDKSVKEHTLDFYLVERAPYGSNCTIDFTLPVPEKGKINIYKDIENSEGGTEDTDNKVFEFEIQKKEENKWVPYIVGSETDEEGKFTITGEGHKAVTAEAGTYRIRESDNRGAASTVWNGGISDLEEPGWQIIRVAEGDTKTLTCTNSFIDKDAFFDLTVTKKVKQENVPASVKFPFEIQLSDIKAGTESITYTSGGSAEKSVPVSDNRTAEIKTDLSVGESVKLSVPYGTKYQVKENLDDDSMYKSVTETQMGTMTSNEEIGWVNQQTVIPASSFTVKKVVEGTEGAPTAEDPETYTFALFKYPTELDADGKIFWEPYDGDYYVNGVKAEERSINGYDEALKCFDITSYQGADEGNTALIQLTKDEDQKFLVREVGRKDANQTEWEIGKETVLSLDSPAFIPKDLNDEQTLICTNSYVPAALIIQKEVTEDSETADLQYKFQITLTNDGKDLGEEQKERLKVYTGTSGKPGTKGTRNEFGTGIFSIPAGGWIYIDGLPKDTGYTVKELTTGQTGNYQVELVGIQTDGGQEEVNDNSISGNVNESGAYVERQETPFLYQIRVERKLVEEGEGIEKNTYQMEASLVVKKETGSRRFDYNSSDQVLCTGHSEEYKAYSTDIYKKNHAEGAVENLLKVLKQKYQKPYFLVSDAKMYTNETYMGGEQAAEEISINSRDGEPCFTTQAFLIWDGDIYMQNEILQFKVKEKMNQSGNGMVVIKSESQGYQSRKYSDGEKEFSDMAAIPITLTMENAAANRTLTFINHVKQGLTSFYIEKKLEAPDSEANTFLFEIKGPKANRTGGGEENVFYTSITIPAGEIERKKEISDVPVGEYTVTELSHMRYKCENDLGNSLTRQITSNPIEGENWFNFDNSKVSSNYFSDTSVLRNKVGEDGTFSPEREDGKKDASLYQALPAALLSTKHDDDGDAPDGPVPPAD